MYIKNAILLEKQVQCVHVHNIPYNHFLYLCTLLLLLFLE